MLAKECQSGDPSKKRFKRRFGGLRLAHSGLAVMAKMLWGTPTQQSIDDMRARGATLHPDRVWFLRYALLAGLRVDQLYTFTGIDRWFLDQLLHIVDLENHVREAGSLRSKRRYLYNDVVQLTASKQAFAFHCNVICQLQASARLDSKFEAAILWLLENQFALLASDDVATNSWIHLNNNHATSIWCTAN